MDILTTRTLTYLDEGGSNNELVLTVFMPFEAFKGEEWRCSYVFSPPIYRKGVDLAGVDFLQALLICLKIARVYLECSPLAGRAHWQGMRDFGLPSLAKRPAALGPVDIPPLEASEGNAVILTSRRLGYPDASGIEKEAALSIFVPFKAEGDMWKCGFALGAPESELIRYGVGADFLEALLDCLAMARAVFERMAPTGWAPSEGLLDCSDLPFKVGRSFATDLVGELPPGSPEFFP